MPIPFTQIPANLLVPGSYQEIDNALAGSLSDVKRVLIPGIKTAAGTALAGQAVAISSPARARTLLGAGGPLAEMVIEFLSLNKTEQLFALPLAENAAGVKAVKSITITSSYLQAGMLSRYIGGKLVQIGVAAGAASADIAANLVAAINATLDMRVEASIVAVAEENTAKVLLTSHVKGEVGNNIEIAAGLNGEVDPTGLVLTVAAETAGAGNPDEGVLSAALAALGDTRYAYMITDLVDAASLTAFADDLDSRYSALRQIGSRLFVAFSGDVGDVSTVGSMINKAEGVNNPHIVIVPRGNNPQTPQIWAARKAALAIRTLADDPAANTDGLEVSGLIVTDLHDFDTRQAMLTAGISTYKTSSDGTLLIERLVTSYTENNEGDRDTSYLDIQVVETIDAIRTRQNAEIRKRFKGWKLASTNENFGAGARVMTAAIMRAFLVQLYQELFMKTLQWAQDLEAYKNSLIIEVKAGSKSRLEYSQEPVLIDQFYIAAGLTQFK